jgi:hypothetical protein
VKTTPNKPENNNSNHLNKISNNNLPTSKYDTLPETGDNEVVPIGSLILGTGLLTTSLVTLIFRFNRT